MRRAIAVPRLLADLKRAREKVRLTISHDSVPAPRLVEAATILHQIIAELGDLESPTLEIDP